VPTARFVQWGILTQPLALALTTRYVKAVRLAVLGNTRRLLDVNAPHVVPVKDYPVAQPGTTWFPNAPLLRDACAPNAITVERENGIQIYVKPQVVSHVGTQCMVLLMV
jgi:hypothetical protein